MLQRNFLLLRIFLTLLWFQMSLYTSACSSSLKHVDPDEDLPSDLTAEVKKRFEVKKVGDTPARPSEVKREPSPVGKSKVRHRTQKGTKNSTEGNPENRAPSQPFQYPSRRPVQDPIWVGERLVYTMSYIGVPVGEFTLEVLPNKFVANREVYHITGHAVTSSVASLIYRLDDFVETYFDYQGLFSHRFHILLDETKQKRDSLELNDSEKKETFFWNRWHHRDKGYSETKQFAAVPSFAQDTMSALYYIRMLPLPTGSELTFPVISEGRAWEAICTVVRREMKDTVLGEVQTIVIRPDTKYEGILRKAGTSYLWLTDDDRRIPVRLEAKVRIGSIVAKLKKVELGTRPRDNK